MFEEQVLDRLISCREVTALPQVLAEVIRMVGEEETSTKQLSEIILKDPALTARVLRAVNSSFYGLKHSINTVNQAVVTLGVRPVKAIVLSVCLYRVFEQKNQGMDRVRFWRHSLETAIACREIASICGYQPVEEAFVAGLMHDLGFLLMETNFPDQFNAVMQKAENYENLVGLEEEIMGINHARVGAFLVDLWKLPAVYGAAIGRHHVDFDGEFDAQPVERENRLVHIVSLGDRLSKFRVSREAPPNRQDMKQIGILARWLAIEPDDLNRIREQVLGLLIEESEFLEIEIGSITDLLEAANRLIFDQYIMVEKLLRENVEMQEEIARERERKAALDSLKTVTATLSHYINNASATIMSRAQVVQRSLETGAVRDPGNIAAPSMEMILKSVKTISVVLDELKKISGFDTTRYLAETSILDIEARLKSQMKAMEALADEEQS